MVVSYIICIKQPPVELTAHTMSISLFSFTEHREHRGTLTTRQRSVYLREH